MAPTEYRNVALVRPHRHARARNRRSHLVATIDESEGNSARALLEARRIFLQSPPPTSRHGSLSLKRYCAPRSRAR
jgi:hypothetical protein